MCISLALALSVVTLSVTQLAKNPNGTASEGEMALTYGAQLEFARAFAQYSGMSGNVIVAWLLQEQPPGSPATPGSNNWLNIQYTDSGPNSEYYAIAKLDPVKAAAASVTWMRANQPSILASKGRSEYDQALAIVNSGWASSKYGGIAKFYAVVQQVAGQKLVATPQVSKEIKTPAPHVSSSNPKDHSPKVILSGKTLSVHGQHLQGVTSQMRTLRSRLITPKLDTRSRNVKP
jgi:hypothetical protein